MLAIHLKKFVSLNALKKIFYIFQTNLGIFFTIFAITSISLITLYSAAQGSMDPWAYKQSVRFFIGLGLLLVVAMIDIRVWCSWSYGLYFISLILLIAVEITGYVGMGAQRWVNLGIFNLQPSELMKIALILALARYFQERSLEETRRVKSLIIPLILIGMPVLLVLRQPDLGTAMILILSGLTIFFVTGVRWWFFISGLLSVGALSPILWNKLHDYQKKRILIFLNPEMDPSHSGYHVIQSKIAIGSGGVLGKGFMKGTQSQLNFLPEKQTDFIFTMFCEEFGMIGGIILIILYIILIAYGLRVAFLSRNHFGRLVAFGMTSTIFYYTFINMAMVMGLLPVVGVPLPFMSYGGTAMLTLLMGQGFILSVLTYYEIRIGR